MGISTKSSSESSISIHNWERATSISRIVRKQTSLTRSFQRLSKLVKSRIVLKKSKKQKRFKLQHQRILSNLLMNQCREPSYGKTKVSTTREADSAGCVPRPTASSSSPASRRREKRSSARREWRSSGRRRARLWQLVPARCEWLADFTYFLRDSITIINEDQPSGQKVRILYLLSMISRMLRSAFQCLSILSFLSSSRLFSSAWILTKGEKRVKTSSSSSYFCFSLPAFLSISSFKASSCISCPRFMS